MLRTHSELTPETEVNTRKATHADILDTTAWQLYFEMQLKGSSKLCQGKDRTCLTVGGCEGRTFTGGASFSYGAANVTTY